MGGKTPIDVDLCPVVGKSEKVGIEVADASPPLIIDRYPAPAIPIGARPWSNGALLSSPVLLLLWPEAELATLADGIGLPGFG